MDFRKRRLSSLNVGSLFINFSAMFSSLFPVLGKQLVRVSHRHANVVEIGSWLDVKEFQKRGTLNANG
jgi:hypothetical protein